MLCMRERKIFVFLVSRVNFVYLYRAVRDSSIDLLR